MSCSDILAWPHPVRPTYPPMVLDVTIYYDCSVWYHLLSIHYFTIRHINLTLLFSFMISELYHRMNRRQLVIRCYMELPFCMAMELENKKWRILWKFPPNFNWFSRCVKIWIKYVCCVVLCTLSAGTIACLICFLSVALTNIWKAP